MVVTNCSCECVSLLGSCSLVTVLGVLVLSCDVNEYECESVKSEEEEMRERITRHANEVATTRSLNE